MRLTFRLAFASLTLGSGAVALLDAGCSGDSATALVTPDAGAEAAANDATSATSDSGTDSATVSPQHVTFRYRPQWTGVTKVEVVGGFGQASDWSKTLALATLTDDGTGAFTGTADLRNGQYLYVFRVTGDAAATNAAAFARYAIDPGSSAVAACPAESPTFSKIDANPCSQLTVPQAAASATFQAKGVVHVDGQPAKDYLVEIERNETGTHHFFVNRVTTGADGAFALAAAPGTYRFQVLHPTFLSATDATRDPIAAQALRRSISGDFPIAAADLAVNGPDLAYHDYAAFAPRDAGTLPTHFVFGADGGTPTRLTVYGGPGANIGDPWYASPLVSTGSAEFDGGFNTKQAAEAGVVPGARYFWGTELPSPKPGDAGVTWLGQSMVFPITWQ